MKKTLIATAVAASVMAPIAAHAVNVSADGTGQVLLYPYYNVNEGNRTFFSMANTSGEAKVMKVRLREGMESEDILDFQVWLSPFDHWSAEIFRNAQGQVVVNTADASCTVPDIPTGGQAVNLERISDAFEGNVQERVAEGHIEAIEMATIYPMGSRGPSMEWTADNDLFRGIVHSNGVPADCGTPLAFNRDVVTVRVPEWTGPYGGVYGDFRGPTGGVYGIGAVYNPTDGTYFTYSAEALADFAQFPIFYAQRSTTYGYVGGMVTEPDVTADEIALFEHGSKLFDLPDLSTPDQSETSSGSLVRSYTFINACTGGGGATCVTVGSHVVADPTLAPDSTFGSDAAENKRNAVATALMANKMANDFLTGALFDTDLVFTFPGKYAFRDIARNNSDEPILESDYPMDPDGPFTGEVDRATGRGCQTVTIIGEEPVSASNPAAYMGWTYDYDGLAGVVDREENQLEAGSDVGFSPGVGSDPFRLCYEVNVISVNDDGDGEYSAALASKAVWNSDNNAWPTYGFVEAAFAQNMDDDGEQGSSAKTFYGLPFMGFAAITDRSTEVKRGGTFMHKITRGRYE